MKKYSATIITLLLLLLIIVSIGMIDTLPWWSFTLPVMILGWVIRWKKYKVPTFLTGFFGGFIAWFGGYLYFHLHFHAPFFNRADDLPIFAILSASGLIGGLLTGLALYTGRSAFPTEAPTF